MKNLKTALIRSIAAAVGFSIALGAPAQTVTYFHNDLSGTPVVATDGAGNQVWRENYRPYGEKLNKQAASSDNRIGFHGKPFDDTTGLSYMTARYYDPVLGRFMGVDPKGFDSSNFQSFNSYAYANNNPYKYVDPDGREVALVILLLGTAAIIMIGAMWYSGQQAAARRGAFKWAMRSDSDEAAPPAPNAPGGEKSGASNHEITPDDLRGKSRDEHEQQAKDKGLVQDPKKPNKWRDPVTGEERIRIDPGHVDPKTGQPYDNPRAAVPHAHGYDQAGNKIRDPQAGNDPHFPINP